MRHGLYAIVAIEGVLKTEKKPILKHFLQVHCQSAFTVWQLCARNLLLLSHFILK